MKKIYIAGCGGMLGEAFYTQFKDEYELKCTDIDLNSPWLSYLDIRDFDAYLHDVQNFKPDYLFHLGAYTDLEFCEKNQDEAYRTNTMSVENAVYIANKMNIPVLYISTAGIFDGKKENYDEWDQPHPIGIYARSKYMGERFVVENARRYLVCRAGWMMGGGEKRDKKFIGKLMSQLETGKTELFVVNDKNGTPTYTHDFAKCVKVLIKKEYWGLYNMACEGLTSRLEVATEMIKLLKLEDKVTITPVNSDYFSKTYFAVRPPSERLDNRKLRIRGLKGMPHWSVSLKDYLENHYYEKL
jgi:dTDP-4-dehydrorhamnose reductase